MDNFGRLGFDRDLQINPTNLNADPYEPMFVKTIPEQERDVIYMENVNEKEAKNDKTLPEHIPDISNEETQVKEVKLKDTSFKILFNNFSDSMIGLINDMTNIRKDHIKDDLIETCSKDNRLTHIGVLAIVVSVFTLIVKSN